MLEMIFELKTHLAQYFNTFFMNIKKNTYVSIVIICKVISDYVLSDSVISCVFVLFQLYGIIWCTISSLKKQDNEYLKWQLIAWFNISALISQFLTYNIRRI